MAVRDQMPLAFGPRTAAFEPAFGPECEVDCTVGGVSCENGIKSSSVHQSTNTTQSIVHLLYKMAPKQVFIAVIGMSFLRFLTYLIADC